MEGSRKVVIDTNLLVIKNYFDPILHAEPTPIAQFLAGRCQPLYVKVYGISN